MSTTTLTTWLGAIQAAVLAVINFALTEPADPNATRWTNPIFWLGMVGAAVIAVKAYYTKGIDTVAGGTPPTPTVKP